MELHLWKLVKHCKTDYVAKCLIHLHMLYYSITDSEANTIYLVHRAMNVVQVFK